MLQALQDPVGLLGGRGNSRDCETGFVVTRERDALWIQWEYGIGLFESFCGLSEK